MTGIRGVGAPPNILFLPDTSLGAGGGHVMRCLSLARALKARGAVCEFAVAGDGPGWVKRFGEGLFHVVCDATISPARLARQVAPDAVVFDGYGLDAAAERPFASPGRVLIAIDDLADREHAADLLLDPGYGRTPEDYSGKAPHDAHLLLGPEFALLRPEFAASREAASAPVRERVERVFVSFGLSDVGGIAEQAVAIIRSAAPTVEIDVALSPGARSLPGLQARALDDPQLRVHLQAQNVAGLIAAADLCVGAGGSSTWERACLGAPTLAVSVAENQRPLVRALNAAGAMVGCDLGRTDFEAGFLAAFERLQSPELRTGLRARSRALCDGRGAERAAVALLLGLAAKV